MSTRLWMLLGATAIGVAIAIAITQSGDAPAPASPPRQPATTVVAPRSHRVPAEAPVPAGSARPLKPIEFARPTGMLKSGSAGPAPTAAPSPSVRDAKLEDRRTAHARFAAGDYASALGASQRVLAGAPDDAAMRKIATASACATGATDTASELAASAPLALRDDLVLQCAKFGVTLDIKPATRTRQAPPRPAKS